MKLGTSIHPHQNPRGIQEVFDLPTLMENINGSKELLRELVAMLRESLPGHLDRIHWAIEQEDSELLYREAHNLKGAVGGLQARRAYEVVCRLEGHARSANIEDARNLEQELSDSLEELATRLAQSSA